jgi:recombination protein RecT
MSAERMTRIALSAIRTTPNLAKCTIQSTAVSLMACSALGLEPNTPTGHAYLIPYNTSFKDANGQWKKEYRCQLIIGYKGYIELFYRSGAVESVQCFPVFEGDFFEYSLGLHPELKHTPSKDVNRFNSKKLTHAYCVIKLKGSDTPFWSVMDKGTIEGHRSRSKAADDGPWKTDYVKMALKTVVRDVVPWIPYSVEKPQVAAAFENAAYLGNTKSALLSLGNGAVDASDRLLEGVTEDAPEQEFYDENKSKMDALKTRLVPQTEQPSAPEVCDPTQAPPTGIQILWETADAKYGNREDAEKAVSALCKKHGIKSVNDSTAMTLVDLLGAQ